MQRLALTSAYPIADMVRDSAMLKLPAALEDSEVHKPQPGERARMEPEDFSADLEEIGLDTGGFAEITGSNRMKVINWLRDPSHKRFEDIPAWVPVMTALLKMPGALDVAWRTAAFYAEPADEEDS